MILSHKNYLIPYGVWAYAVIKSNSMHLSDFTAVNEFWNENIFELNEKEDDK